MAGQSWLQGVPEVAVCLSICGDHLYCSPHHVSSVDCTENAGSANKTQYLSCFDAVKCWPVQTVNISVACDIQSFKVTVHSNRDTNKGVCFFYVNKTFLG